MDKAKRTAIIAGNWKMNKTPKEAVALLNEIKPLVADADCEVIACVPYVDLAAAVEATAGTNIKVGAENCHWAESGAFTGEISTGMLKEIFCRNLGLYVIPICVAPQAVRRNHNEAHAFARLGFKQERLPLGD